MAVAARELLVAQLAAAGAELHPGVDWFAPMAGPLGPGEERQVLATQEHPSRRSRPQQQE